MLGSNLQGQWQCRGEQRAWEAGEAREERRPFEVCPTCGEKEPGEYFSGGVCESCYNCGVRLPVWVNGDFENE